jgi:hypothetical protein
MRRLPVTMIAIPLVSLLLSVASNIAASAVPDSVRPYIWLAWPVTALLALLAIAAEVRYRPLAGGADRVRETRGTEQLEHAAFMLAQAVKEQWEAEAEVRSLHEPNPIRLRWSVVGQASAVSAPALRRLARPKSQWLDRRRPPPGGLDEIAGVFEKAHNGQLLVLGDPGAGKSVLAILLTLGLLERRTRQGGPVPLLLSLSSWDPKSEHLHEWVVARLLEDYPELANSAMYGPKAGERLVASSHLLPILDGLDEIPDELHAAAIAAVARAIGGDRPVVVTCRRADYQQAVAAGGGRALASATTIALEPVGVHEAIEFLSAGSACQARWAPVFAHLSTHKDGHLAQALSAPLMVALARAVYADPAVDPAELCDAELLPDRAAVELRLLDGFIDASYSHTPLPPATLRRRSAMTQRYPPDLARKWLTFLACHLDQQRTPDLAWWQLHQALPRATRAIGALVLALADGLVCGIGAGIGAGPAGLAGGLTGGLVASLMIGLAIGPPAHPKRVTTRIRDLPQPRLGREIIAGLAVGLGAGTAVAFAAGPPAGVSAGLAIFAVVGFVGGLVNWLNSPADTISSPTAGSVMRQDKRLNLLQVILVVFGTALAGGLAVGAIPADVRIVDGIAVGLAGGLAGGLVALRRDGLSNGFVGGVWSWFLLSRTWLALGGRLPWQVMRFLDDAHRRGVLRQAGAVYQFRHERLHEYLLATAAGRTEPGRAANQPGNGPCSQLTDLRAC